VPSREIRRGGQHILKAVDETLLDFPTPHARGCVLERILVYSVFSGNLLSLSLTLSSEDRAQRGIVSGLQQSLLEVKSAKTFA